MSESLGTAVACPPAEIAWQVHPARERWGAALTAGAVILGAAAAVALAAGGPGWGVAAAAVLTLSLNRFFFPSRFALNDEGIAAEYLLSRRLLRWTEVRRFVCDRRGGYLSTRQQPSRLDAYRGLHVLFGGQREELVREIRRRMGRQEAVTCSG